MEFGDKPGSHDAKTMRKDVVAAAITSFHDDIQSTGCLRRRGQVVPSKAMLTTTSCTFIGHGCLVEQIRPETSVIVVYLSGVYNKGPTWLVHN